MIIGFLFVLLSVITAGLAGLSACISNFVDDPYVQDYFETSLWWKSPIGKFIIDKSKHVTGILCLISLGSMLLGLAIPDL